MYVPRHAIILTADRLRTEVDYLMDQDRFVFDVETEGVTRGQPVHNKVTWVSFASYGRAFTLPLGHRKGDRIIGETITPKIDKKGKVRNYKTSIWEDAPRQLRWPDVVDILRPLFFDDPATRMIVGHNLSFDLMSISKYFGAVPPPPYDDTMITSWLLNENHLKGLKDLTRRYFKLTYDTKNVGRQVERHSFSTVAKYTFMDARYTWLHHVRQEGLIEREGLAHIAELEREIIEVVVSMGLAGAPVDSEFVAHLEDEFADRLVDLEADIYRAAGRTFNVNSNPQKTQVLFGKKRDGGQGLKPLKFTDTGAPSTDKAALEPYAENPVVAALTAYNRLDKLQGTYVKSWLGHHDKADKPPQIIDGRIHASFKQAGTDTGRFSSSDPNVQNIPARTQEGQRLREAVYAAPHRLVAPEQFSDWKQIVADYDQIELRILAHFARDGRLYEAFMNGEDPHAATAAAVFGKPIDKITKVERSAGKGSGFAVIYGSGAATVSAQYGVPLRMAEHFLDEHPRHFPEIYALKDKILAVCRSRRPPHVKTLLGRKRRLPEIHATERWVRNRAERQAVNSVIQGSNADITKLAMVHVHRAAPTVPGFQLILTVHDELVALCPAEHIEAGVELMRHAMLGPHIQNLLRVPVTADVKVVDRWNQAK